MTSSWIASALRDTADRVDTDSAPSRTLISTRLRALVAAASGAEVLTLSALPGDGGVFWDDDGEIQDRFDSLLRTAGAVGVNWDVDVARVTVAAGRMSDVLQAIGHVRSGACGEDLADFACSLEPIGPSAGVLSVAARIAAPRRKVKKTPVTGRRRKEKIRTREERHAPVQQVSLSDMLEPATEYGCQMEISLSADFEGTTTKQKLLSRLKNEIVTAIQSAVSATAQELDLRPGNVLVRPLKADCAVNDASSFDDE